MHQDKTPSLLNDNVPTLHQDQCMRLDHHSTVERFAYAFVSRYQFIGSSQVVIGLNGTDKSQPEKIECDE